MAFITTVKARLRNPDPAAAMAEHNEIVAGLIPRSRPLGGSGHQVFASAEDPDQFLAVDRWESIEGLQAFMGDPEVQQEIGRLFDGPPEVTVWMEREGWTTY